MCTPQGSGETTLMVIVDQENLIIEEEHLLKMVLLVLQILETEFGVNPFDAGGTRRFRDGSGDSVEWSLVFQRVVIVYVSMIQTSQTAPWRTTASRTKVSYQSLL